MVRKNFVLEAPCDGKWRPASTEESCVREGRKPHRWLRRLNRTAIEATILALSVIPHHPGASVCGKEEEEEESRVPAEWLDCWWMDGRSEEAGREGGSGGGTRDRKLAGGFPTDSTLLDGVCGLAGNRREGKGGRGCQRGTAGGIHTREERSSGRSRDFPRSLHPRRGSRRARHQSKYPIWET